jgi:hypothetical protein
MAATALVASKSPVRAFLGYALIGLLAGVMLATPASAANCKKGQPCGNSCISWDKVCRILQDFTAGASPHAMRPAMSIEPT